MSQILSLAVQTARHGSLMSAARELRRYYLFPRIVNGVRGKFASFEEASRAAPAGAQVGYESDEHARMYDERIGTLFISDYVVLYWLSRLLPGVTSVFDLGGHKGELLYGFRERLQIPKELVWRVYDVPTTVREGERLARERGIASLVFTTDLADASGSDLLIASGVLQYLEAELDATLATWARPPKYIIVNNTPMYEGPGYVTLQNTGLSYNPYKVFNRAELIQSVERRGYVVKDAWRTERSLSVPLHPELHVQSYQGFFAERA